MLVATAVVVLLAACRSSGGSAATTTTTLGPRLPTTSTTTTTLGKTLDPAFHTRRAGVLTVASDRLEPPYFVMDPTTQQVVSGYEYDIARALASRLGLGQVRVIHGSLELIEENYDCGCDLFLGGVATSDALARSVDLSVPFVAASPAVVVRAGSAVPTTSEARSLRWGYVVGDPNAIDVVNERIRPVITPIVYPAGTDVAGEVAAGLIDAGLLPAPEALLAAKADARLSVVGRFDVDTGWAAVEPLGSANSPSLNDLMEQLRDDGTLAFLSRLHLGMDPTALPVVADR